MWASGGPNCNAISFEAAPRNITILNKNIAANDFSSQIQVIAKAAGKENGSIAFECGPADQTGWGGITSKSSTTSIEVPVVRLDAELAGQTIDVLKIDVEGADTWVLFGAENLLREKKIKTIFFEQNLGRMKKLGIPVAEAVNFLGDLGYRCVPFNRDESEWVASPRD